MNNQLYNIVNKLAEKNNIRLNATELKLQLLGHPSYPSLHSITGVLNHFHIENVAMEVPNNMETLTQLPKVFITLIEKGGTEEFVLVNRKNKSILLEFDNGEKRTLSYQEFLNDWKSIVLIVEKSKLQNNEHSTILQTLIYVLGVTLCTLISFHFLLLKPKLYLVSHFVLSLAGAFISYLILRHELGFESKVINQLCTASDTTSCDDVLRSKGATLFKQIKISDLSIIYFSGLLLNNYAALKGNINFSPLVYLSLFVLPITIYSIYYQSVIVKKWCLLCLGIITVLWFQGATFFFTDLNLRTEINLQDFSIVIINFLMVSLLWVFFRPLLNDQKQFRDINLQYILFRRNFNLFNASFSKGKINIESSIKDEIILGNQHAPLHITLVTNPSCFYCKEAHSSLEHILKNYGEEIKVTIRFNIKPKNKDKAEYKIALRLLELFHEKTVFKLNTALHEIYQEKADPEKWLDKWGEPQAHSPFNPILSKQYEWCVNNGTNFTPAFFIDNKPYPEEYDRNELVYFLDPLLEQKLHEEEPSKIAFPG